MALARSIRLRRVLIDSSAYFALLNADASRHSLAEKLLAQIATQRLRPFTTSAIIIECHALVMSKMGVAVGTRFLRLFDTSNTTVIRPRLSDEVQARAIIFRYSDKSFSFTDAISFVVMERLAIPYARSRSTSTSPSMVSRC